LGVVRDSNPYLNFHRVKCSSFDSPLTITTPYKNKKSELFWSSDWYIDFNFLDNLKWHPSNHAILFQYRTGC